MCKKVVVLVIVLACVLTGCSKKGTVSGINDTTSMSSSLQNEQGEHISKQSDESVLAGKYNVDSDGNVLNFLSTVEIPYKSGENYEIYTDEVRMHYHYMVKDKYGYLLDEGYTNFRALDFYEKNGLLVLYRSGDLVSYSERYYDIPNSRISRFFWRPVAMSDKLVAYFVSQDDGQIKLIVQDIFDPSVYYTEIQRDFSDFVFKDNKYKGEFLNNNIKLKITYPVKDKEESVTEEIRLD